MDNSTQIEQYRYLITLGMKKLKIMGHYDDFYQIGLEAIWEATQKYDSLKGEFEPFAYFYIINRMKTAMTKMNQFQAWFVVTEDKLLERNSHVVYPMEDISIEDKYFNGLTAKQKVVMVERFLNNRSVEETANYLGITIDAVKNRTRDAKKSIIKMLETESQ